MRHETKAFKNVLDDLMANRSTHECTGRKIKMKIKDGKCLFYLHIPMKW